MEGKHYYKKHAHVISVLTTKYGFEYIGLGDNSDECFFKDSSTPERIYVHPMHCSYSMSASRTLRADRLHPAHFESNHRDEEDQEKAFNKLLVHLDKVTVKRAEEVTHMKELLKQQFSLLEEKKVELQDMAANKDLEKLEMIPSIYKNVTEYHLLLSNTMSLLK